MAETATPHDAVFKTFLSRVETARDFIEIHLPPRSFWTSSQFC